MSEAPSTPAEGLGQSRPNLLTPAGPTQREGATARLRARREVENQIIDDADAKADAREAEAEAKVEAENERKAGLSWDDSIKELEAEAPHLAKLARELRADYTRKTQTLSAEKKRLAADKEALVNSGTLNTLREKANTEVGELNPFDEGSINARIEREVARRLAEALEPLEREHKQAQARQKYDAFLEKHPDLKNDAEIRKEVYDSLQSNPGLDLQSAYYAVKGRRASSREVQRDAQRRAEQKAARAAALTATGQGRKAGVPTINKVDAKNMSAWEIYSALKKQRQ